MAGSCVPPLPSPLPVHVAWHSLNPEPECMWWFPSFGTRSPISGEWRPQPLALLSLHFYFFGGSTATEGQSDCSLLPLNDSLCEIPMEPSFNKSPWGMCTFSSTSETNHFMKFYQKNILTRCTKFQGDPSRTCTSTRKPSLLYVGRKGKTVLDSLLLMERTNQKTTRCRLYVPLTVPGNVSV